MMSTLLPPHRLPKYRHYKPKNLAVVRINGKDHYLGKYGSEQSHEKYRRLVANWLADHPSNATGQPVNQSDGDLSIAELLVAYLRFAEDYYRRDGKPTKELANIRQALRPLRELYSLTSVHEFGPLALKTVRQAMINAGLCRNEINKRIRRIVGVFRWGVENELVPSPIHHGLKAVSGLRKGQFGVRESEPVRPVDEAFVNAVQPYVSRQVWAMIQLQRLTGMRPGEVVLMRQNDLNMTGPVWTYIPETHKTEHHGHRRTVYLGPQAQGILRPWLREDRSAYLFSPREALEEHWQARRSQRRTPMTPSQRARRRKTRRSRPIGEHYTTMSYGHAIARACKKAGIPRWHSNQLRHNAATRLRKEFGIEAAQLVLGHARADVTQVYAERDEGRAREIALCVG